HRVLAHGDTGYILGPYGSSANGESGRNGNQTKHGFPPSQGRGRSQARRCYLTAVPCAMARSRPNSEPKAHNGRLSTVMRLEQTDNGRATAARGAAPSGPIPRAVPPTTST